MGGNNSNIDDVGAWLGGIFDAIDTSKPAVAEALARPIRTNIADRAASHSGPEGAWAPNVGRYAERKAAKGLSVGTGLDDESPKMLDADQLEGEIQDATQWAFDLAFGKDDAVKHRGQWFQNGSESSDDGTESSGAAVQIARPFWGLTDKDGDDVIEAAEDLVSKAMK